MASVSDFYKKYNNYKEKQKALSLGIAYSSNPSAENISDYYNSANGKDFSLEKYKEMKKNNQVHYDIKVVNDWFDSVKKNADYISQAVTNDTNTPAYKWATNSAKNYSNSYSELKKISDYVRTYIESLKGTENYDELSEQFNLYMDSLNHNSNYLNNWNKFAASFKNEDQYNSAIKNINDSASDEEKNSKFAAYMYSFEHPNQMEESIRGFMSDADLLKPESNILDITAKYADGSSVLNSWFEYDMGKKYKDYTYEQLKEEIESTDDTKKQGWLNDYANSKINEKYKDSNYNQRAYALTQTDDKHEAKWLKNHLYDNSTSEELQEVYDNLTSEWNSLYNSIDIKSDEFNPEANQDDVRNRLGEIEERKERIESVIENKKYNEKKKVEYDDVIEDNIKAETIMQRYYYLEKGIEVKAMLLATGYHIDDIKIQSSKDAYNYAQKLSSEEIKQIRDAFETLPNKDTLYKYYKRDREEQETAEEYQQLQKFSDEHPVLGSLASVGLNTYGSVADAGKYIGAGVDKAFGGDGYINADNTNVGKAEYIRENVSEDMGDAGKFFYNTGMSIAENVARMPLLALPGGEAASLAVSYTSSGVSSANDVIKNGGSIEKALMTGAAAGAAEIIFEKIPLDNLIKIKNGGYNSVWKAVSEQMVTEGLEELGTDVTNAITDQIINGDMSQLSLQYKNYIEQGYSKDEAWGKTAVDFGLQVAQSFAGGAISGGVLSGGAATLNYAENSSTGKAVYNKGNADELVRIGKLYDQDTQAYNLASKVEEKTARGKSANAQVGQLRSAVIQEASKQFQNDVSMHIINFINKQNISAEDGAVLKKFLKGEALSENDVKTLNKSKKLQHIAQQISAIDSVHETNLIKALKSTDFNFSKPAVQKFKTVDTSSMSPREALKEYAETYYMSKTAQKVFIENYDEKMDMDEYAREFVLYNNYGKMLTPYDKINHSAATINEQARFAAYEQGVQEYKANAEFTAALKKAQNTSEYTRPAFGFANKNGVTAKDSGGNTVIIQSIESSSKNYGDSENHIMLNTADGRQISADDVTFSSQQIETLVNSAKKYDTNGARAFVSEFEEYAQFCKEHGRTPNIEAYINDFGRMYDIGRSGGNLQSVKSNNYYAQHLKNLGTAVTNHAILAGEHDVNPVIQNKANKLLEIVSRSGRVKNPNGRLFVENGVKTHIDNKTAAVLQSLASKLGRDIILTDNLQNDRANGQYKNGKIYLNSNINDLEIMTVALHEAGHSLKEASPAEFKALSDFVVNYLTKNGYDVGKMVDKIIDSYGENLLVGEGENLRDAALEEVVCNSLMSIAADKNAFAYAVSKDKSVLNKIADALKKIAQKIKDYFSDVNNYNGAEMFIKNADALMLLAEKFSAAAESAKNNIIEYSEYTGGSEVELKYSLTVPFEKQVENTLNNIGDNRNAIYVTDTSKILVDVGLEQLPMLYTKTHLRNALKPKSKTNRQAHGLTKEQILLMPEIVEKPAIIIDSLSRSDSIVLISDKLNNYNEPLIMPIKPNGSGIFELDLKPSNFINSFYGKEGDFSNYIERAINENKVLFIDKSKSRNLFRQAGLQCPSGFNKLGFDKIIHRSNNIVNNIDEQFDNVNIKPDMGKNEHDQILNNKKFDMDEHAADEYTELRTAVQNAVSASDWNRAVKKQLNILEKSDKSKWNSMSETERAEYASKEALAEFCSDMLKHSDILEKMANDNPKAAKTFIDTLKNIIKKIRSFLSKQATVADEATALEETADDLQSIVDKWDKAVMAGIKNQNAKTAVEESANEQKNNTADGSSFQHSIRNTKAIDWNEQIENYYLHNGLIKHSDTLVIEKNTPGYLYSVIDNLPLALPIRVISKAQSNKNISHSVTDSNIKNIQKGIKNSVATIYNKDRNSLLFITDIKQGEYPLVVAFEINSDFDGDLVHKCTSIHLRTNLNAYLSNLKDTTLFVKNKNEFNAFCREVNILDRLQKHNKLIDISLSQDKTVVNNNSMQADENNSDIQFKSRDNTNDIYGDSFKKWFGDWQNDPKNVSKVVNLDGMPKAVYHGSSAGIKNQNAKTSNQQTEYNGGNLSYLIRYTTDNYPVVVINENILDGVPRNNWINTIKNIIKNKFANGIPINGKLIKVNLKTRNEYTKSKYSQKIEKKENIIYEDKFKSANNLDEIILASTNYINEALNHKRKDNFKEFARGDVLIRVENNDYSAKVIVGFTTGNDMVLYDVIDFSPTKFLLKNKKADTKFAAQSQKVKSSSDVPTNNTVSPSSDNVNNNSMQADENNSDIQFKSHDNTNDIYGDSFKKWFGDWQNDPKNASKVVKLDGTPKAVYHGSPAGIKNQDAKTAVKESANGQKNNTFSGVEESGIQFQERNSYPYNMQTVIQDYLDSVDDKLLEFVNNVENGDKKFRRLTLSDVSEKQSNDIKRLIGFDVTGYKNAITTDHISHIIKRHGIDGQQDSTMQNPKDIARMCYILKNYDSVELLLNKREEPKLNLEYMDINNKPAQMLMYSKKINGTYYVIEAIPENNYKKIWVISAYMSNLKEDTVTQAPDVKNPRFDARDELASPVSSNNRLSQDNGVVNNNSMQADENNSDIQFKFRDNTNDIYGDSFKKWFGDWQNDPKNASKVVNLDGTPKAVYHDSPAGIKNQNAKTAVEESANGQKNNTQTDVLVKFSIRNIENSFNIPMNKLNDYVYVQRKVFNALLSEGFFTDEGGRSKTVINKESGMEVEINKSGIKETFNYENYAVNNKLLKLQKLATIRNIPEILENGEMVGDEIKSTHELQNGIKFAYIKGATIIDDEIIIVKIGIKKSVQKNKFWVHYIVAEKNTEITSDGNNSVSGSAANYLGADKKISQSDNGVKKKIPNGVNNNTQIQSRDNTNDIYGDSFKRWFGDWQNDPKNASKVVNLDGTPKAGYHDSPAGIKNQDAKTAVKESANGQKNNTFSGVEESGIQFQERNSYPYNMQTVIQDYLDSVDDKLLEFVNNVENGDKKFRRLTLSDVSEKQSNDIKRLIGIDVTGYKNAINTSGIIHIIKRHGKNGQQDHTMKNSKDIARVAYILNNYDNVELQTDNNGKIKTAEGFVDKNNQNSPLIIFTKKINGTYYAVEAVGENSFKKIWVISTYIAKTKEDTVTQVPDANLIPKPHARDELASPVSSNNRLSQDNGAVNNNSMQADENNSDIQFQSRDNTNDIYGDSFKRWFGDWQNDPKNASKVVNLDGTPKAGYHDSPAGIKNQDAKTAVKESANGQKNNTADGSSVKYNERYEKAETNKSILNLINKVESGNFKANEKVYFDKISSNVAKEIYNITGVNVQGYRIAIEARQLEHILKNHGKNGRSNKSMSDYNDIAKIEYVMQNYDSLSKAGKTQAYTYMKNGRNRTADTVLYEKQIGKKSYYIVQAVPETKAKTLYIVTAFIGKSGYNKKETSQLINAKSPDVTPKDGSARVSNNIISDFNGKSNINNEKNQEARYQQRYMKSYEDTDLSTLDDEEIKVYNKRGWSYSLFTKEDSKLLQEKFAELKTSNRRDNILADGTRIAEINKKIVLIGGTFENPQVHSVLVINSNNATDTEELTRGLLYDNDITIRNKQEFEQLFGYVQSRYKQKLVRIYSQDDFRYIKSRDKTWQRATIPSDFQNYGYTQQFREGRGNSAEAGERIFELYLDDVKFQARRSEDYYIDEHGRAIYDLAALDDEEIKVYNKRGWAGRLFTDEERKLLGEKYNELNSRTSQRTDNVLGDGSRIVEINNKIVLIGGTFEAPEIYSVLAINAKNETDAEFYKEWILYDSEEHKRNKSTYIDNCTICESVYGGEVVRTYISDDFKYHKGSKDTRERALLPNTFQNYGYTQQFRERRGNSAEAGERISESYLDDVKLQTRRSEDYYIDEHGRAIYDIAALDDEELKVYNNRGWSYSLFTKEDSKLLQEKFAELKTSNCRDNVLADGTRIAEINNKIVLIGGDFENPQIHSVLAINADSETYAAEVKEGVLYETEYRRKDRYELEELLHNVQTYFGQDKVRVYSQDDFRYIKSRDKTWQRATIPSDFQNYGYTQQFREGRRNSAEAGERIFELYLDDVKFQARRSADYYNDEHGRAIYDLAALDDEEIKVYNKRGWASRLFTDEERKLLGEKYNELNSRTSQRTDNVLGDGSRVVEINNKIVLIGGTFEEPEIYSVLAVNAKNEIDADVYKEIIYNEQKHYKRNKSEYSFGLQLSENIFGIKFVRSYESADFSYHKGSKDTGERAVLPDAFQNYGYTQQFRERRGNSAEAGERISESYLDDVKLQTRRSADYYNDEYERTIYDLAALDDEEIKVYNKRGWASRLFTDEERKLLGEKYNELNSRTSQRTDNVLGDGSRIVEINNKIVLIGGTFEKPEIYSVLAINAENETAATEVKEVLFDECKRYRNNRYRFADFCKVYEGIAGKLYIRTYLSEDFTYQKGRKDTGERALLPNSFQNYGYTQQFRERRGNSAEAGERISDNTTKFSMAGEHSKTADLDLKHRAEAMERDGVSSEEIRQKTGWFKGYDGKWRYEIDNSEMKLKKPSKQDKEDALMSKKLEIQKMDLAIKVSYKKATKEEIEELNNLEKVVEKLDKSKTVSDFVSHPRLFEAYPQLKDVPMGYRYMKYMGSYDLKSGMIAINIIESINDQRDIIIHEIQHAIQQIEGFAKGASEQYWMEKGFDEDTSMKMYFSTAGEIEANDVSLRLDYTEKQRKDVRPYIDRKGVLFAEYEETTNNTAKFSMEGEHSKTAGLDLKQRAEAGERIFELYLDDVKFQARRSADYYNDEHGRAIYDLAALDDEEIKVYNKRGWASRLFTDEERKLLGEKYNELNSRTSQRTDNVLGDGSRIVEINNKIVLIGGTFEAPEIYSVLAINAKNETEAEALKEIVYYEQENYKRNKSEYSFGLQLSESIIGGSFVRSYESADFSYHKGSKDTGERAVLPDTFQNYGYTQQFRERRGNSAEAGERISESYLDDVKLQTRRSADYYNDEYERTIYDLAALDDEEIKVYNKRGWASRLFTDEERKLLGEKYNELNNRTSQRTDNVLGDGSRIVEINNKIVLIGGTFEAPEIYSVLAVNAKNETEADIYKELIRDEFNNYKRNKDALATLFENVSFYDGQESYRAYRADDFTYHKGRKDTGERALLPNSFQNYGYTQQFRERRGNSAEAGERISDNTTKFSMAGEHSKTADLDLKHRAEAMERDGVSSEEIRQKTGWFKGYDGKWRYEIDNSEMKLKKPSKQDKEDALMSKKLEIQKMDLAIKVSYKKATKEEIEELNNLEKVVEKLDKSKTVSDFVSHPRLFEAYPQLKDVPMGYRYMKYMGSYDLKSGMIAINIIESINDQRDIIIHEIQHAIQQIEGFAKGASERYWMEKGFDEDTSINMYFNTAGEIEANDVSLRLDYTEKQRKDVRPYIDRKGVLFAEYEETTNNTAKFSMEGEHSKTAGLDLKQRAEAGERIFELYLDDVKFQARRSADYYNDEHGRAIYDLAALDDEEIRAYNKRGWASRLFTDEERKLLGEKYNELNNRTSQRTDNVLGDGSRVVEINNKIVLIGGTFEAPEIYSVLAINAENETEAEAIKEWVLYESKEYRQNKSAYVNNCELYKSVVGEESIRNYNANDFRYYKGRKDTGERAVLPDAFQNYGYTQQFRERRGNSAEAGERISESYLDDVKLQTRRSADYYNDEYERTIYDLAALDDEEIKVYNKRGWASRLFTDEERKLLGEKYNELNSRTSQRTDNVLGDGSRIVEINNKIVLIGGTFEAPEIYSVLAINAENETDADIIKEEIYDEHQLYRQSRYSFENFSRFYESFVGNDKVRTYVADDFSYRKGSKDTGERASLPDAFQNYGYTQQFRERRGNSAEAGERISESYLDDVKLQTRRSADYYNDEYGREIYDLAALDDEEIRAYNKRGWASRLFTDEERKLLGEKYNELNSRTSQRTDNVLGDGSRIVEINNKIVLIGGTFEAPEIYSVLAVNAKNEIEADIYKEEIYYESKQYRKNRYSFENFSRIFESVIGNQFVRSYESADFSYRKGSKDTGERASLPDAFQNYGYTQQFRERRGNSAEAGERISDNTAKFSMAGEHSKTADLDLKHRAEAMERDGVSSEEIRQKTGWFKGYDGKWRYEIDNSEMKLKKLKISEEEITEYQVLQLRSEELLEKVINDTATETEKEEYYRLDDLITEHENSTKLSDYVSHPKLFAAYPELKDVRLRFEPVGRNADYSRTANLITLDPSQSEDSQYKILVHELQHAIQRIEGFATGSSPFYWIGKGYNNLESWYRYKNTAGEIEAFDVFDRMTLTNEQRKAIRPDIDIEEVFFAEDHYPFFYS